MVNSIILPVLVVLGELLQALLFLPLDPSHKTCSIATTFKCEAVCIDFQLDDLAPAVYWKTIVFFARFVLLFMLNCIVTKWLYPKMYIITFIFILFSLLDCWRFPRWLQFPCWIWVSDVSCNPLWYYWLIKLLLLPGFHCCF